MDHLFALLSGAVLWLIGVIGAGIGIVEAAARQGLSAIGVTGQLQTIILLILLVVLIVAAFRLFGRLIAALVILALLFLLLHTLLGHPAPTQGETSQPAEQSEL